MIFYGAALLSVVAIGCACATLPGACRCSGHRVAAAILRLPRLADTRLLLEPARAAATVLHSDRAATWQCRSLVDTQPLTLLLSQMDLTDARPGGAAVTAVGQRHPDMAATSAKAAVFLLHLTYLDVAAHV